ncbi:MAG TPA: hypothetical protein VKE74_15925 [Gemmataceae bacterium]|nr:hypothetical protein [Gemmataceae bacterium]
MPRRLLSGVVRPQWMDGRPMTEAGWLAGAEPGPMLEFLPGKATDRKLRLFACACCRHTAAYADAEWRRMAAHGRDQAQITASQREAEQARRAAEVAERYADGLAGLAELHALFSAPGDDEIEGIYASGADAAWAARSSAYRARYCAEYCSPASYPRRAGFRSSSPVDRDREQSAQSDLLRDIFGNPFRPVTADPAWLTSTVLTLAQGIYADRAFDRLPILADALQDAGCENPDILTHCRGAGPHVRGCWVVDLLLGRH